jgi:cold shock CspA family protein
VTVANGAMLWFHEEKGYGFIRTDDGERVYVERAGFVDGVAPIGRCAGLPVELRVVEQNGKQMAVDVSLVEAQPTRRARRRSR